MSVETKVGIYRAAVLPVLLYGAEVWVLSVKESTRLEVFHRKCLRVILGITKRDHWRNERVLEETGMCDVDELVTRSRLRWLTCCENGRRQITTTNAVWLTGWTGEGRQTSREMEGYDRR